MVNRNEDYSEFKRLDEEELKTWLEEDYTLGDLWNKNVWGATNF